MVGAPGEDNGFGAVYWYEYENRKLVLKQRLVGPNGGEYSFGTTVATDGYMVVVGCPKARGTGIAHLFFPDWEPSTGLFSWASVVDPAGDVSTDAAFGSRITLTPDRVFISAPVVLPIPECGACLRLQAVYRSGPRVTAGRSGSHGGKWYRCLRRGHQRHWPHARRRRAPVSRRDRIPPTVACWCISFRRVPERPGRRGNSLL